VVILDEIVNEISKYISMKRSKYKLSKFSVNFLTLFSGSSIAQFIPILISPILSRLFTPEEFGKLALYIALTTFVSGFMTGAYDTAIMLPKKKRNALNILGASLIFSLIVSLIVGLIFIIFGEYIARNAGDVTIERYLFYSPLIILLIGIYKTLNMWFTRYRNYRLLASTRIGQTLAGSATKLAAGLSSLGFSGLVASIFIQNIVGSGILVYHFLKKEITSINVISKNEMVINVKRYKDFPKYSAPQGILDMVNKNGFVFIFSSFYGVGALGLFDFGVGKVLKPLQMLGPSLSQVFYEKASQLRKENQDVWPLAKKILILLVGINVLIILIMLFWGPLIFAIVFGPEWSVAGVYARIVAPWFSMRFISSTLSTIPILYHRQKEYFKKMLILNIAIPGILLVMGVLHVGITTSLLLISSLATVYLILLILWFKKISSAS
jgi:O-antigen/teichoic acid export membrane protein